MIPIELIYNVAIFVLGLGALLLGGDSLVRGSSKLAQDLGISPVIIGLTVIAFGTSSPEFVVCLVAAIKDSSDIAIGNIVGSNISNIGLILGLTAIVSPIAVHSSILKRQTPFMIGLTIILFAICFNFFIGRVEGAITFLCLSLFIIYNYFKSKIDSKEYKEEKQNFKKNSIYKQVLFIIIGLAGLIIGARLVVDKSILFARALGVSELVIGITAVAIGTSLPELSASLIAAFRKHHDLVVGNIIGSNIFNIGILGLVSLIQPIKVNPGLIKFELPVMLILSLLILPIMKTGSIISRAEGIFLLIIYLVFIYFLF